MIQLVVITGPMRSGKTTMLGRIMSGPRVTGNRVALLRPAVDRRASRQIEFVKPRFIIDTILKHPDTKGTASQLATTPYIAIDEGQFMAEWSLDFIVRLGAATRLKHPVVFWSGLTLKADGTEWPGVPELLARANQVIRLHGTCEKCGAPGTMTGYDGTLPPDGIRPGDSGYHCLCKKCWTESRR